jgi:hypothetical protein
MVNNDFIQVRFYKRNFIFRLFEVFLDMLTLSFKIFFFPFYILILIFNYFTDNKNEIQYEIKEENNNKYEFDENTKIEEILLLKNDIQITDLTKLINFEDIELINYISSGK